MIKNPKHKSAISSYYITIFITQDASGAPISMMYRTTSYAEGAWDAFWYEKNLQGDIIAVYNASGTKVATYTYSDAWGNHSVSYSNSGGSTGAQYNPFRYRGYYYDNAGNITSITTRTERQPLDPDPGFKPIIKAAGTVPTVITTTKTLSYSDSQWGDLLTSFDGHTITYDEIGNPLSYYNGTDYTFTWDGRRLVGAVSGSKTMSFTYNDDGIRTSKTVNGVTTTYYVNGGQIVAESNNSRAIVYIYDATGTPIGMMYRTTSYAEGAWDVFWYEKNLQGDIIAVYNASGTKVATYTYSDAWGNHYVSYSNGGASTGAQYNPFRYRGYYYDTDLGMYYLQSRYYDAKICRFISADSYISTGHGMISFNMFAYCNNNPVNCIDPHGKSLIEFWEVIVSAFKRFYDVIHTVTQQDLQGGKGGPVDENTAGSMESATDINNSSHSIRSYKEGGGDYMMQTMYQEIYGDIFGIK